MLQQAIDTAELAVKLEPGDVIFKLKIISIFIFFNRLRQINGIHCRI